jgi:hypothetical protein
MLNYPVEVLHPVFIETYNLIFRDICDQFTYGRNHFIWRAGWGSRYLFLEHFKEEEVSRRWIWTVSWSRDSTGFCCSKGYLTFLLLCGRALSRWTIMPRSIFPRLSWYTCSTTSGTTDSTKKVVFDFMPFGTYNRLLVPVLSQIIEMRHRFGLNCILRNFRDVIWICSAARMAEIFNKEPAFVPC